MRCIFPCHRAFFFKIPATPQIYTLSLHDALPISAMVRAGIEFDMIFGPAYKGIPLATATAVAFSEHHNRNVPYAFNRKRSEEHTSELQSHHDLVCRLLLEKKKIITTYTENSNCTI